MLMALQTHVRQAKGASGTQVSVHAHTHTHTHTHRHTPSITVAHMYIHTVSGQTLPPHEDIQVTCRSHDCTYHFQCAQLWEMDWVVLPW